MAEGMQIEVVDGFAHIEFVDATKRGEALAALLRIGGPGLLDVDTSGTRKTYVVPESIAEAAGLLDTGTPIEPIARKSGKARTETG